MRTFSLVLLGLAVGAADGTRIEAHGENKFPPNYRDVMSALDDLTAAAQKNALQQYTP